MPDFQHRNLQSAARLSPKALSPCFGILAYFTQRATSILSRAHLNLACRGLEDAWSGDLFGGDNGEVSPSSTAFSSSSLMDGNVSDGPFISDSC